MSEAIHLAPDRNQISDLIGKARIFLMQKPEWWAWLLSISAWILLLENAIESPKTPGYPPHVAICIPIGHLIVGVTNQGLVLPTILSAVINGLPGWVIMMVAMMFPLLNKSIRHVTFSVRQKDRAFAIAFFLVGYAITWAAFGVLFIALLTYLNDLAAIQTHFGDALFKASGFLLAAILVWNPARPVWMTKCSQTAPIRIQGWQLHFDSLRYGLTMGLACLAVCWAPMAALTMAYHNLFLMFVVTTVIIYERYLLPHTSKLSGYVWGVLALILFVTNMWF